MPSATPVTAPPAVTELDPQASAFPVPIGSRHPGIPVLDWLAAMAMQGLVTHGMEVKSDRAMTEDERDREVARRAYRLASAMLQARWQAGQESPVEQPLAEEQADSD